MRKPTLAVLLLAAVTGQAALATTISQPLNWGFGLSPGQQTLAFGKFDTMGGTRTLTKVTLILDSTLTAAATAENDKAGLPGVMGMEVSGSVEATAQGLDLIALLSKSAPGVLVDVSDGVSGSGPDFHDFGTLTDMSHKSLSTMDPLDLVSYTGPGTFDLQLDGKGGFAATGVSDATIKYSNFGASGIATVVYEFTPEPASILSLLSAGMLFFRRRR
jgi:hypothetical protein